MESAKKRGVTYYAMNAALGGGYVGVTDADGGPYPVGVAIPFGSAEAPGGDRLALFELLIGGLSIPGPWMCRGRRFVPVEFLAAGFEGSSQAGRALPGRALSA